MIKKIDANKYGVVRYAISSIEDIADLPREVSVGSEAILVNEDGEKKFRLGSDGWVEVVEVKEYDEDKLRDILEDAKVGYGGIEYETLEERLDKDFDDVYSALDNRTYVEYEGCKITAKDSLNGLQKETVVKGRTLQNILKDNKFKYAGSMGSATISVDTKDEIKLTIDNDGSCVLVKDLKVDIVKGQIYTAIFDYYCSEPNIDFYYVSFKEGTNYLVGWKEIDYDDRTKYTRYRTTLTITDQSIPTSLCVGIHSPLKKGTELGIKNVMLLEGDHTQTPLEELPFIEGIESVGDKSKNLFDGILLNNKINNSTGIIIDKYSNEHYSSNFIQCDSLKTYTVSVNYNDTLSELMLFEYDYEKNFIKKNGKIGANSLTVTLSNDTKYIRLSSFKGYGFNEYNFDFQLEEGTQATPYEPYYDGYKISGKSHGKNLAKEISEENYVAKGEGEVIFENNKCVATDKSGWASCFISSKEAIKVKPNTIYYGMVECEEGAEYLSQMKLIYKCFDRNNNVISTSGTVTLSNNAVHFYDSAYNKTYEAFLPLPNQYKYVKFSSEVHSVELIFRPAGSSGTITNTFKNILFVETDKQPTYEPYKESTYSYILDEPLRSLPNGLCDEIDLEKGVVTRRVGKVVLDETTIISSIVRPTDENFVRANISDKTYKVNGLLICDSVPNFNIHTLPDGSSTINFECICSHNGNNELNLVLKTEKVGAYTETAFSNYLKNNPVTVYYELTEPTTEYLIKDDKFVTLPNGVKDEISHNSVLRKVGKVVFDGSEDEKWGVWTIGGENVYNFVVPILNLKSVDGNPLLCNIFKYLSSVNENEEGIYNGSIGRMGLKISKTKLTSGSIDEFRKWLTLNPITVYYELETPYTESINPNEVILDITYLKSYEPITHITSDNYLLPTIETQVPSDFNAVVLGLKSNNEALASQVMSLRQTNDELETTNREQDDVIDVTLLALDEVYGMIDEGEVETMSIGSPMVNVYVKMIKRGIKTLDEVPTKYRAEVEELI